MKTLPFFLFVLFHLPWNAIADNEDEKSAGEDTHTVMQKLAREFSISEDSVLALYISTHKSYGEISHALSLSSISGAHVNEVFSLRIEKKMGWGQVVRELSEKYPKKKEELDWFHREQRHGQLIRKAEKLRTKKHHF